MVRTKIEVLAQERYSLVQSEDLLRILPARRLTLVFICHCCCCRSVTPRAHPYRFVQIFGGNGGRQLASSGHYHRCKTVLYELRRLIFSPRLSGTDSSLCWIILTYRIDTNFVVLQSKQHASLKTRVASVCVPKRGNYKHQYPQYKPKLR